MAISSYSTTPADNTSLFPEGMARAQVNNSARQMQADIRSANALANQLLEGVDINGNESIDPITGEGGAITAYEHAEYMADMPILPKESQQP